MTDLLSMIFLIRTKMLENDGNFKSNLRIAIKISLFIFMNTIDI